MSPGEHGSQTAAAYAAHQQQQQQQGFSSQTAEFFLSNYRLGKTLGIGSFGKVGARDRRRPAAPPTPPPPRRPAGPHRRRWECGQVFVICGRYSPPPARAEAAGCMTMPLWCWGVLTWVSLHVAGRSGFLDVLRCAPLLPLLQVKVAEHILTGHKVAIKILNRKKIKQMDMEEKGGWLGWPWCTWGGGVWGGWARAAVRGMLCWDGSLQGVGIGQHKRERDALLGPGMAGGHAGQGWLGKAGVGKGGEGGSRCRPH